MANEWVGHPAVRFWRRGADIPTADSLRRDRQVAFDRRDEPIGTGQVLEAWAVLHRHPPDPELLQDSAAPGLVVSRRRRGVIHELPVRDTVATPIAPTSEFPREPFIAEYRSGESDVTRVSREAWSAERRSCPCKLL